MIGCANATVEKLLNHGIEDKGVKMTSDANLQKLETSLKKKSAPSSRGRLLFRALAGIGVVVVLCLGFAAWVFGSKLLALRELKKEDISPIPQSVFTAVTGGNLRHLELLGRAGVSLAERDSEGFTPLLRAIEHKQHDVLGYLSMQEKSVLEENGKSPAGLWPLAFAASRRDLESVRILVTHVVQPDVDVPVDGGRAPALTKAAKDLNLEIVEALLQHPRISFNKRDEADKTALYYAVHGNHETMVSRLLDRGADPNLVYDDGRTLLLDAVNRSQIPIVRALLDHGAGTSVRDDNNQTALHFAIHQKNEEIARMLLKHGGLELAESDHTSLLWKVVRSPDPGLLNALLEHGFSANTPSRDAKYPSFLHYAIDTGNNGAVYELVTHEADTRDALRRAVTCGELIPVALLLTSGKTDLSPSAGPVLGMAIRGGNPDVCDLLLEKGANPEQRCLEGQRALPLALALRNPEIVRVLLEHGANPNKPLDSPAMDAFLQRFDRSKPFLNIRFYLTKDSGVTPLMLGAMTGSTESCRHLMEFGAARNVFTNKNKFYPVNFAAQLMDWKTMRLILGQNPDTLPRKVVVDLSKQQAILYKDGKPHITTSCSTGKRGYRTKTGNFVISNKYPMWTSTLYHSKMPFFMRLSCGDFGFHSGVVPGYAASHGCIRLPYSRARQFYSIMRTGDLVQIVP